MLSQLDEEASVTTVDISAGYNIAQNLLVNISAEKFNYDSAFKSSYAIAPVEERATFELEWQVGNLKAFWQTVWFGSRDLTDYGYEGYDVNGDPSSLKPLDAASYHISNARFEYQLSESMSIYGGASNVFEKTQIDDGDSPLFYDADGGYDVAYIYGAMHGREFYAGFKVNL